MRGLPSLPFPTLSWASPRDVGADGVPDPGEERLSDYDYDLPSELIAQDPVEPRDESRLMVLRRSGGPLEHRRFRDVGELLAPGDLLVVNDTKVVRARLVGTKVGGTASGEALILAPLGDGGFEALVRPGRRLPPGSRLRLADGTELRIGERLGEGLRRVDFPPDRDPLRVLREAGRIPLPPYITRSHAPEERYQTVYAREEGSAAAPTAGLHFTPALLESLERGGIGRAAVTLHVGVGTFRPVTEERIDDHRMHEETCFLSRETIDRIVETRSRGGRVIAVGTTVVRTLESFADEEGRLSPGARRTRLFIRPGYSFRVVDGLITNFHLPKSTLLMLVSALVGRARILEAYREAVRLRYRFFSFGDAMILL
jgi:S-adenosylmethionine:tRNA ribosyltransferase-isomerase